MKRRSLLLLLVSLLIIFSSQKSTFPIKAQQSPITVTIFAPANNGLSDTNLTVAVAVNSLYQVSAVKARVENREVSLTFSTCAYVYPRASCNPGYAGSISLAGLPSGPKQITATATDVFNNTATAQNTFIYDQFPRLSILDPVNETVARPNLRVKVSCEDDYPAGCNSLRIAFNGFGLLFQPANGSFDGEISLPQLQGQSGDLCVSARDSASQLVEVCRTIHVESSPMLTEVFSAGGKIWDVQENRVLYSELRNGVDVLKIRNRVTGVETELAVLNDKKLINSQEPTVFLTPQGAIFSATPNNDFRGRVYEWRDGQLTDGGAIDSPDSLKVAGNYAIWTRNLPAELVLRDLVAGTNQVIASGVGNWLNDLTPDGQVVYWVGGSGNYKIRRYRNGQTSEVPGVQGTSDVYPLTDGDNIVFRRIKGPTTSSPQEIVLQTSTGEKILSPLNYDFPSRLFRINQGWVAFTRTGSNGGAQVWLRSPSGQETQKSFFQAATYPDSVSPGGELSFILFDPQLSADQRKRYLPVSGQPPLNIGSSLGRTFWKDEKLFVILGRSLFQFSPLANVSAASFSGSTLATEGITAVFGSRVATATQAAATQPLPTSLAGTTVTVRDSLGMQRAAPLFFVSPGQINYQIPAGTAAGQTLITITSGDGTVSSGTAQIAAVAPSLFTANASGQGVPAATLLRVKANGEQIYEPVAYFDSNSNQFVARTIQIGPESEQDFLILFGTGLRYRSTLSNVTATIRGESVPVFYAGPQPDFVGLDQANIALPRSLFNRGSVDVVLTADQRITNAVRININ